MHDLRLAFGGKKQRGLGMEFHILRDAFVFSSRLLSGRRISQRTRPQGSVEWSGVPIFGDDKPCPAGRPQSRCFRIHPFFSVTFCTLLFERLRGVPFHAVKPVKKEPVLPFHRREYRTNLPAKTDSFPSPPVFCFDRYHAKSVKTEPAYNGILY